MDYHGRRNMGLTDPGQVKFQTLADLAFQMDQSFGLFVVRLHMAG
ncbi:hypothetical protein [Pseudarthrobacter sp. N5]